MARESKGKAIKGFTMSIMGPDMQPSLEAVKVFLDTKDGAFYIYLPDHIGRVVRALDCYSRINGGDRQSAYASEAYQSQGTGGIRPGYVRAAVMDRCIDAFKDVCASYAILMKAQNKRKMLHFVYKANLRYMRDRAPVPRGGTYAAANDIAFVSDPALHLQYSVLWEAGGVLYTMHKHGDDETLAYFAKSDKAEGAVIEWTQERENFLASMVTDLETLIMRVQDFTTNLAENVDTAIAQRETMASLAAPTRALPPPARIRTRTRTPS